MGLKEIITILVTFVILAAIAAIIYIRYKNSPKDEDKEAAKEFLNGLKDNVYNLILNIIKTFNYKDYATFLDLEADILNKINLTCTEYIKKEISKNTSVLSILVVKALDSNMIDEFIDFIIKIFNVEDTIQTHANAVMQETLDASKENDDELQKEYADEDKYYSSGEFEVEDLDKVIEEEITKENEEHLSDLKPEREE